MDLLLEGGTVVTMDPDRRIVQGTLHVRDGAVASVGEVDPKAMVGRVVRRIDCSGRVIIPGFVQSHVHLCQTLFRGHADGLELLDWLRERIWPFEGAHTFESLKASARLGIAELIRGGTTACLDMATVRHTDAVFEAAAEAGFRLTCGKAMMDVSRGLPAGLRESTKQSLAESDALLERWHEKGGGRLRYAYAPRFVLSCTEPLLEEVAARARANGVPIHTHASENQNELEAVRERCGMDNVAYLNHLGISGPNVALAHCVWLTAREQRLLADTGTHLLHCPSSNLKLASGIAKIPELLELGVQVSLGADGAPCNNNLDMWTEMRLAALIHLPRVGPTGLPAEKVFEMATLGGARALGLEDRIGSIETGKRADLAVVDLDGSHAVPGGENLYARLVYSGRASDVRTVVIDGEVVMDEDVLTTVEEDRVIADAMAHARTIVARVG
jgi:5-methylthioadenosine/S-adenosylhomocysteine deaminase